MRVAGASPIFGGGENIIWHVHTQLGCVLCVATMQPHIKHVYIQSGCTLYVATMQPHIAALFDTTLVSHVQV